MSDLHDKMLKEVEASKGNTITERLHVWMCNCDDPLITQALLKEDKTLNKATEYLYAKGSKIAVSGVADVTPELEIEWFKEYLLNKNIKETDLKKLPPARGEVKTEVREVVKEVVKEVIVEKEVVKEIFNPTFEQIGEYLKSKKKEVKELNKVESVEIEQESLF